MFKACSKCGKIHPRNYQCNVGRIYSGGEERNLRSTYAWTCKSAEIREKANYLCEVCRDQDKITESSYQDVEVHHIEKLKENNSLLLDNYNLICLCVEHHKQADNNEIDKEYLKELARKREDEV